MLASSLYNLMNQLSEQRGENTTLDIHLGVTTTDLGIAYGDTYYSDALVEKLFSNDRVKCYGRGDDGALREDYSNLGDEFIVPVSNLKIVCYEGKNNCYEDWECMNIDASGKGVCVPRHSEFVVGCPPIHKYSLAPAYPGILTPQNQVTKETNFPEFAATAACLLQPEVNGCNYEQPLGAVLSALKKLNGSSLLRHDALTVILLVTDEEDCSIENKAFFEVEELGTTAANVACGRHSKLLSNVNDLYAQIIGAKTAATGKDAMHTVMFAAITGVPVASPCEGPGDQIGNCLKVRPQVNGNGTMGTPDEIEREVYASLTQTYYEYACTRQTDGEVVTKAYPARRLVEMAQNFGKMGFVFSICNDDWTPLTQQLGAAILARVTPKSL